MHTKSLAVLKRQAIRKKMVRSAKESIRQQATNEEMYGKMQDVFINLDQTQGCQAVSGFSFNLHLHLLHFFKLLCFLYVEWSGGEGASESEGGGS